MGSYSGECEGQAPENLNCFIFSLLTSFIFRLIGWVFFLFLGRVISALKVFCKPGDFVKDCLFHMNSGVGIVT